jgi:hypothetical protein
MSAKRKVAVTVSADTLAAAERLRKDTGESRSAVFERALQGLLDAAQRADRSRRYVEAYRRAPERATEVDAALRTALVALGAEPWDAAG